MKKTLIVILLCLSSYTSYAQGYIALPPIQYQTTKSIQNEGDIIVPDTKVIIYRLGYTTTYIIKL